MIPFKVKLKIPHFQRVTTTMFGKTASEIRDRVDKFVRDIKQQLGKTTLVSVRGLYLRMQAHIFHVWFDLYTWIDA